MATSAENSAHVSVQPGLNGGTLRRGNPGNKGGPGRTPDRIRAIARKALRKNVHLLGHFAAGVAVSERYFEGADGKRKLTLESCSPAERMKAIELLDKIATGEKVPVHEVRARLSAQLKLIRQTVDADTLERLLPALAEVWK
jgi:hypothetical protein